MIFQQIRSRLIINGIVFGAGMLTVLLLLPFLQSFPTANISDAFRTVNSGDDTLMYWNQKEGTYTLSLSKELHYDSGASLRVDFLYDSSLGNTIIKNFQSDYPISVTYNNENITFLISLPDDSISAQSTLLSFVSQPQEHTTPILESISLFEQDNIEQIGFAVARDMTAYHY